MKRRYEYERLLSDMYTVHVKSNLAIPFAGSAPVEVGPRDTVGKLVKDFLFSQEKDGLPELAAFDEQYNKLEWDATAESQGIKDGSTIFLIYDKSSSSSKPLHIAVVGFTALIIAIVLFLTVVVLFSSTGGDVPFDYGIVIDAGSTHTEVFLYQWSGSKYHGTGEVSQKNSCNIDKGIADGYDPSELVSCVNNVTKTLPADITSPVQVFLGATAGMRILNASNPLEAHLILTAIKYALKGTLVQEGLIDIIQGQDEGIFSWITTNFLSKTLVQNEVNATYGALDLGGASTQLAFALSSERDVNISDVEILKLYGHEYHVLTKSFLCFGLSQAADRSEAIIFMNNSNATILDPCLPKNYSLTLNTRKFLEGPCIRNNNLTSWLELNGNIKEFRVTGTGNYGECKKIIKMVVNIDKCREMKFANCLENVSLAKESRKFMAFSSFYYVANYLSPNGSLEEFVKATKDFCSLSYDEIKNKTVDPGLLSHLVRYCFGGVYIVEILTSVYGFNNTTWENIIFQQNIKGADVGWALGFMINSTNAIPEELPRCPVISLGAFIPLVIVSVLLFIIAIKLIKNHINFRRKKKDSLLQSIEDI